MTSAALPAARQITPGLSVLLFPLGFLVMLFSGFATLREFGYLTALTMLICLLADLLLLPALLVRLRA